MTTLKKSVEILRFLALTLAVGALLALTPQTGQAAPVLAGQAGAEIAPEDESPYSYIKGFIRYADGTPIAGVTLTAVDLFGGTDDVVSETDGAGAYALGPFADDAWFGTVTPAKTGFTFTPAVMEYATFVVDQVDQNYVGDGPPPTVGPDPTPSPTPPTPTEEPTPTPPTPTVDPTPVDTPTPVATPTPVTPTVAPTPTQGTELPTPTATEATPATVLPTPTPATPTPTPTPGTNWQTFFDVKVKKIADPAMSPAGIVVTGANVKAQVLIKVKKEFKGMPGLPVIPMVSFDGPAKKLQSDAIIEALTGPSDIAAVTMKNAYIEQIEVGQIKKLSMSNLSDAGAETAILYTNSSIKPAAINLVGVLLAELNAPDSNFKSIKSSAKVYKDEFRMKNVAPGGIGDGFSNIVARSIGSLQTKGASIEAGAILAQIKKVKAAGMTANLGDGFLEDLPGDIIVDMFYTTEAKIKIQAVGGDIPGGVFIIQGLLADISAKEKTLGGFPTGGSLGGDDLLVVTLAGDIKKAFGSVQVDGIFYAGAQLDTETFELTPTYRNILKVMATGKEGDLAGEIHMMASDKLPKFKIKNGFNTVEVFNSAP